MKKNAGSFVLVIYGILAIYMIGCSSLEEDAAFVGADPPSGSDILPDHTVTVTFDNTPVTVDVEIQGQRETSFWWELDGKKLTVRGNPKFRVDRNYVIIITWATGRKILNYYVPRPPRQQQPESGPLPAEFVSVSPSSGSEIAANATITLTFSNDPGDVTSSAGTVAGGGKTRIVTGPLPEGALTLNISWTNGDGSTSLSYTVRAADSTAPTVTGGTVSDGDEDVDPEDINGDGMIEITFSEEVSGNIALQTEGGDDVGWIGKVEGTKGTLELVKGKEIGNETTYVIAGKVSDAAGNETEVSITFITEGKE